jgi:amino acid permease
MMLASTMLILVYCSDLNKDNTYHDVLLSMCGKRAQQLAAASIMSTCFGIGVTFLIIIGDQYDRSKNIFTIFQEFKILSSLQSICHLCGTAILL